MGPATMDDYTGCFPDCHHWTARSADAVVQLATAAEADNADRSKVKSRIVAMDDGGWELDDFMAELRQRLADHRAVTVVRVPCVSLTMTRALLQGDNENELQDADGGFVQRLPFAGAWQEPDRFEEVPTERECENQ